MTKGGGGYRSPLEMVRRHTRRKKGNTVDMHATYDFKCFLLLYSHTNSVRKVLVFPFFHR